MRRERERRRWTASEPSGDWQAVGQQASMSILSGKIPNIHHQPDIY